MSVVVTPRHSATSIEFTGVSFGYTDFFVLEDISFSIASGDFVGIIGPNGGGKTTLLKLLLGLLEPTMGAVTIFGHTVHKAKEHCEIGYVPQHISHVDFTFPATVEEVVKSGRTARRKIMRPWNKADALAVEKTLHLTGVFDLRNTPIGELSGGQRQRVFIARALSGEPKILILDEPTVGVDSAAVNQFNTLLTELNRKQNMTIVMVSHDIEAVTALAKKIITVNKRIT